MKKDIKKIISIIYYNLFRRFQNKIGNRILLYHAIGTKLEHDSYGLSISKETFFEHMMFLKENYEIIPIDDDYVNNLDRNTVSITFDDGYEDNLYALEICEKLNIPFTLYITTGMIAKKNYLNRDQILKFANSKVCALGTHSVTHPHLDTLSYEEQYTELQKSKRTLEEIVGYEITYMSFPHGNYNNNTLKILDEVGYNITSSSHIGLNTKRNIKLKELKRIEIISSDNIVDLNKKILGYYDYLALRKSN